MSDIVPYGCVRVSIGVTYETSAAGDSLDLPPAELRGGTRALAGFQRLEARRIAGDGARHHALEDRGCAKQVEGHVELPVLFRGTRPPGARKVALEVFLLRR